MSIEEHNFEFQNPNPSSPPEKAAMFVDCAQNGKRKRKIPLKHRDGGGEEEEERDEEEEEDEEEALFKTAKVEYISTASDGQKVGPEVPDGRDE